MKNLIETIDLLEEDVDHLLNNLIDCGESTPEQTERLEQLLAELREHKESVVSICRKAVS